ncbi:MAG TPA: transcriptional regulator [Microbacterium sp.]|nr:transcriptional regulator [Microbacterium sp.]
MDTRRAPAVGVLLRDWRQRRRLSQLALANYAETSTRHLSYLETGRARPSRAMVIHLSTVLEIPLRERNALLLAAGYAPEYRESDLDDDYMRSVRFALDTMLKSHEPYPAFVIDRFWNVVASNRGMTALMDEVPAHLMDPRPNVFRLVLHPDGLSSRLINRGQVRAYFLERLSHQVISTGDADLRALHDEVVRYPAPKDSDESPPDADAMLPSPVQVPLRIRTPDGDMSMFSTMATFGAPADVTLSELAIEFFYPLDEFTDRLIHRLVEHETRSSDDRADSSRH